MMDRMKSTKVELQEWSVKNTNSMVEIHVRICIYKAQ